MSVGCWGHGLGGMVTDSCTMVKPEYKQNDGYEDNYALCIVGRFLVSM